MHPQKSSVVFFEGGGNLRIKLKIELTSVVT